MITIGVDAHKRVHAAVAVDEAGKEVAQWRGPNTPSGWTSVLDWAKELGLEGRQWGIEGAWGAGRGLAQVLAAASETVYEVNARLTAWGRRGAKKPDKSDRLDAQAVARIVRQEAPGLPEVTLEDECAVLEIWVVERATAISDATRLLNQLHAALVQIDPEYEHHLPKLKSPAGITTMEALTYEGTDQVKYERTAMVRRLAARLRLAREQADEVTGKIQALTAKRFAPLAEICGVSSLTAGVLASLLGPGRRFCSDAQLAAYAGVAPLETSSAGKVRHRLNRGGNRRLNAALYFIALTQARFSPDARAFVERRVGEGKTRREAMRALKRYIIRAIWRQWTLCYPSAAASAGPSSLAA